ncbi:MAG: T9SS type A sorting domain-containing protein [bacterium]
MTNKYSLLLICFLSMSMLYAQDADLAENDVVEVVLSSEDNSAKKENPFNPNGIRLTPQPNAGILKMEFIEKVNDLSIDIIDRKGKLISQFKGEAVAAINFDTKALYQGTYFIRVTSSTIEDFLRFEIK